MTMPNTQTEPQERERTKKSDFSWQTALTLSPVACAAMLYLAGTAYNAGYLEIFGVGSSLFPTSLEEMLSMGFIVFFLVAWKPLYYLLIGLFIVTLVTTKLRSWFVNIIPSTIPMAIGGKSKTASSYLSGFLLILFLLIVVFKLSSDKGKEQAHKKIEAFNKQEGSYVMLHTPLRPAPVRAKQIACGPARPIAPFGSARKH